MTVLTACQEAAVELSQSSPVTLFSSTDKFDIEIRTQANKAAVAIAKAYEWQKLTALQSMTGDGVTTSFTLPTDYDRMLVKGEVQSSQYAYGYRKVRDLDSWLNLQLYPTIGTPGYWIILGGTMQFTPALADGVLAKFYYIKNKIVTSGTKTAFTVDTDTFDLPERLLVLDMIWRWRASKRMDYAEDMRNFEIALAEETSRDKGSRTLVVGRQRVPIGAEVAHPAIVV